MKITLLVFFTCAAVFCNAQINLGKYNYVDEQIAKQGNFPTNNVAEIADAITSKFNSNEEKARSIFYWIANNIAMDPKAIKQRDDKNKLPEQVIALRKATPLGYSLLFQEMCSYAKIRCLSVDGYVKNFASEINEKPDEINYSWNVVQLGESPEAWYYVDACRASGFLDVKETVFTKQFTSQYFFADKKMFNQIYFPDNGAWLLGGGSKSIGAFYALPVIGSEAVGLELRKILPLTGVIKTTVDKEVPFAFSINNDNTIKKISILIGDNKKKQKEEPMNFDSNNGDIKFAFTFKKEDSFPIEIVADGKTILKYLVEVKDK